MPSYTHKPKKNVISPDSVVPKKTDDEFPFTSGLQVLDEVFVTGTKSRSTPQSRRRTRALDSGGGNLFTPDAGNIISSGGESNDPAKNDLISKLNKKELPSSLYGSNRFDKLWSLYNKVKDQEGIENNPEYHRLIKKLSRKMPRTLKNLEKNIDKSLKMRQKINTQLGNNTEVASKEELLTSAQDRANQFINDPFYVPPERDSQIDNEDDDLTKGLEITNNQRGENLGPRLGSNISAALKNKKW